MDDVYREYFRRAARLDTEFERRTAQAFPSVRIATDRAAATLAFQDRRLREDAVQFLRVNLIEMVIAPIMSVERSAPRQGLFADLENDVDVIVREAAGASRGREVSAHAIVDALSHTWPVLRSMRPEVWG